jgi:hypothetical protein
MRSRSRRLIAEALKGLMLLNMLESMLKLSEGNGLACGPAATG